MKDDFRIKFDSEAHQIDANTFVNYLIHFNALIQEINRELAPERQIRVKINALEGGSFDVAIELQSYLDVVLGFFTDRSMAYLGTIMGTIGTLITLKQYLSKKPTVTVTSANNVTTINASDGTQLVIPTNVYNIYNTNPVVSQAITKQFETLENDPQVTGLELREGDKTPIAEIPREDFAALATAPPPDSDGQREEVRHTILSIVKLSFDEKLKSEFIYMNTKISAYIKDKAFYSLINQGKAFAKGDALEVNLKVNLVFDASLGTHIIKSYEILNVIRHIPRNDPGQLQLNLNPYGDGPPQPIGIRG